MKLRGLIVIAILIIVIIPSINAQFHNLELSTNDDTNKANSGYDYEWVFFAFGRITNLREFCIGYTLFYGFDAIDLICIRSTDRHPRSFLYRFNDGERLCMPYPVGIINEHFIFALSG